MDLEAEILQRVDRFLGIMENYVSAYSYQVSSQYPPQAFNQQMQGGRIRAGFKAQEEEEEDG